MTGDRRERNRRERKGKTETRRERQKKRFYSTVLEDREIGNKYRSRDLHRLYIGFIEKEDMIDRREMERQDRRRRDRRES